MNVLTLLVTVSSLFLTFLNIIETTTIRTTLNTAPLEFPKVDQNYTFLFNSSIRENLENHTSLHNDTEVGDLLSLDESTTTNIVIKEIAPEPSEVEEDLFKKNLTELIEDDPANTEDKRIIFQVTEIVKETEIDNSQQYPLSGNVAAILAMAFVAVSIVAYVALITWRKHLENRYGSRTMLVTEDFMDPDDMKHFSI